MSHFHYHFCVPPFGTGSYTGWNSWTTFWSTNQYNSVTILWSWFKMTPVELRQMLLQSVVNFLSRIKYEKQSYLRMKFNVTSSPTFADGGGGPFFVPPGTSYNHNIFIKCIYKRTQLIREQICFSYLCTPSQGQWVSFVVTAMCTYPSESVMHTLLFTPQGTTHWPSSQCSVDSDTLWQ